MLQRRSGRLTAFRAGETLIREEGAETPAWAPGIRFRTQSGVCTVSGKVSSYSAQRIKGRVAALGRQIARDYRGRKIDVVVTMDRGFVFAADLLRQVNAPVICHFVREQVREVRHG